MRHDGECAQLLFNISKEIKAKLDNEHWYGNVPKSNVSSHECEVAILRKKQVQTDRTLSNNKPDIIIRDNKKGTCMLTCCSSWWQKCDQERS